MAPHQARVVQEKLDLDDKISKLSAFMLSEKWSGVDGVEQFILTKQRLVMGTYSELLRQRIKAFKPVNLKAPA